VFTEAHSLVEKKEVRRLYRKSGRVGVGREKKKLGHVRPYRSTLGAHAGCRELLKLVLGRQ